MKNKSLLMTIAILMIAMSSLAQETGTFTDSRDGKTYKTVKIGTQTWMAENLNYNIIFHSWCNRCNTYGRLYTYYAALTACPSGWHLPSDTEWTTLTDYLGGENVAGDKLKSKRTWRYNPNPYSMGTRPNNSSGFSALASGRYMEEESQVWNIGDAGNWWTSTKYMGTEKRYGKSGVEVWVRSMDGNWSNKVFRMHADISGEGYSVRCLRDE